MTTATGAGTTMPAAASQAEQTPPRKRRRRAPTTGAADDCFTCRDRGVSCDRRRPYCSQCLEMKMTCSGYKTQLTWGVGVASRGKLRGLSLPVAKGKPASTPTTAAKTAGATATATTAAKAAAAATSTAKSATPSSSSNAPSERPVVKKPPSPASSTSASSKSKPPRTPSVDGVTPQPQQQPTPTPSTPSVPVSYAFVGVGADAPVQSAPPFQTSFEWPPQPKYASSDIRHQPLHGGLQTRDSDNVHDNRPLKRQALHLDTHDLQQYPRHAAYHPMSAAPVLSHAEYTNRPYNSPISPYQHQVLDNSHVWNTAFSPHGAGQFQFGAQRNVYNNSHHQRQNSMNSMESPNHWSTGYPSPIAGSDHGSYVSTPDQAYSSGNLSDPSIGMAADQLLAMQHPQHRHFFPQTSITSFGGTDAIPEVDEDGVEDIGRGDTDSVASNWDLLRVNQTFATQEMVGNSPELRYLINYYLEVLTPVIIAFDGPGNPWREHVLSLARHNEGLQHAIAALSASNLRMRREHKNDQPRLPPTGDSVHDLAVRRSSEAHERLNDELEPPQLSKPGAPSKREMFHKTMAIRALNKQLADPAGRSDDSILAILLVICLYHMCETGVARFRTQFAGVKKIMAMRNARRAPSKEINWMLTFFKWFDAMAATVNDRESQFAVESSFPVEDEDWGLENLAGCDSQLFAVVNKLGRLNVLSQGKDPSMSPMGTGTTPPLYFSPVAGPHGAHLHPDLVFDNTGWAQMSHMSASGLDHSGPDQRSSQFWTEWAQVRQELMSWRFDPSYLPTPMRTAAQQLRHSSVSSCASASSFPGVGSTGTGTSGNIIGGVSGMLPPHQQFVDTSIADISNISESFRHAALLYTERLAWPNLPPEHHRFQSIVITALRYIRLVKSDVCLLWPLFIVGAECVAEEQRSIVRTRVWDIQKDSGFFNNIKCLELLEVIWDNADKANRMRQANGGWDMNPPDTEIFKWRREMKNSEGEYIVI